MGRLYAIIAAAVKEERFILSSHVDDRLRERRMTAWQLASGIAEGKVIREHPRRKPRPTVEVAQTLADGTPVKVVWSWDAANRVARLVTVHFFDR